MRWTPLTNDAADTQQRRALHGRSILEDSQLAALKRAASVRLAPNPAPRSGLWHAGDRVLACGSHRRIAGGRDRAAACARPRGVLRIELHQHRTVPRVRRAQPQPVRDPPQCILERALRRGVIGRAGTVAHQQPRARYAARDHRLARLQPLRQSQEPLSPAHDDASPQGHRRPHDRLTGTLRVRHHPAQRASHLPPRPGAGRLRREYRQIPRGARQMEWRDPPRSEHERSRPARCVRTEGRRSWACACAPAAVRGGTETIGIMQAIVSRRKLKYRGKRLLRQLRLTDRRAGRVGSQHAWHGWPRARLRHAASACGASSGQGREPLFGSSRTPEVSIRYPHSEPVPTP